MIAMRPILLATFILGLISGPVAAAEGNAFLQGYVRALLDQDYPDLAVTIADVDTTGRATLASDNCVPAWLRAQVERSLTRADRITAVGWDVSCTPLQAQSIPPEPVEPLPNNRLFTPLLADPRQPRFSAAYQYHETTDRDFNAGSVSFGEHFGLASGEWGSGHYQVGIAGGVFALFNLDAPSNDLVNADYMVGLPLSYRDNAWSARARIYHVSSHLGDEFLLRNPDVERINLSYEAFDTLVSWEHDNLRLYGGGGLILQSEPQLDPWLLQYGVEYRLPRVIGDYDLDLAANFKQSEAQDWILNQSYQVGLSFRRDDRVIRILFQYYTGLSPNGQFFTDRLRYYGLGVQFGL